MAKKSDGLAVNFVLELFAASLEKRTVFEIVKQYLKYSYLQEESEKKLWKFLCDRYNKTGKVTTLGQLQQHFSDDEKVLDKISDISDVEIDQEHGGYEVIIESFETFIKKMKFLEANDKITEVYNRGEKENAWELFTKYAEDFSNFTIQSAKFDTVFGDFEERQAKRKSEDWKFRYKIPTMLDELDYRLGGENGGPETGECFLWMADSGGGKSQLLVHLGIAAARQGFKVAHFQLEGTKEQCLNRYDASWTGTLYQDMKAGDVAEKTMEISKRVIKKLRKSDIVVSSEETFNAKTLVDVRREIKEMQKTFGKIDVIIIDYLELLEVGDGHNYSPSEERFRQSKLAKGMKMLAMEFNTVVHTATQSGSFADDQKNDPEFVITRFNLSEDKGKIRPFDLFATLNQTKDERKDSVMRIHTDKLREYENGEPIYVCNNFAYSRFYDRKRTMNMDWEDYGETRTSKVKDED